tara:strand:+ start:698 stop:871 length:174 start_codon:yes stop_codon:yes gene_type:complete
VRFGRGDGVVLFEYGERGVELEDRGVAERDFDTLHPLKALSSFSFTEDDKFSEEGKV